MSRKRKIKKDRKRLSVIFRSVRRVGETESVKVVSRALREWHILCMAVESSHNLSQNQQKPLRTLEVQTSRKRQRLHRTKGRKPVQFKRYRKLFILRRTNQ